MKSDFSCIIIDDEQNAINLLAGRLQLLYDHVDITGTYTTWTDAVKALRCYDADIVFLDVSMPERDGMTLLKLVPGLQSEVIFVTAHSGYALDAFKVSASGYILKPFDDKELTDAIGIALKRRSAARQVRQGSTPPVSAMIGIPNDKGIEYVHLSDILYFESVNSYTRVVTRTGELLSSYRIGKFRELAENSAFFQVHRSYLVNINCIRRYVSSGEIIMLNNKEIPVSRSSKEAFLSLVNTVSNRTKEETGE